MGQEKRWATGFLEILVSPKSPLILTLKGRLQFRQCLAYLCILFWALRSIPQLCYAILPSYCSCPRWQEEVSGQLPSSSSSTTYTLRCACLRDGLSIRAWWNNQRMRKIAAMNAWFLGALSVGLKLLGISDIIFEVTQKNQPAVIDDDNNDAHADANANANANAWRLTFNKSPIFILRTIVLLVNLAAGLLRFRSTGSGDGFGIGEVVCSVCVVLCLWAFLKSSLWSLSTIYKSLVQLSLI